MGASTEFFVGPVMTWEIMGHKSAAATPPTQQESTLLSRVPTHTRSAKYRVNSLRSFIRSSLEYITLVIQKTTIISCSIKFSHSTIALGRALGESWNVACTTTKTHWCPVSTESTFTCFRGKAFLGKPALIVVENTDVSSWIKFRQICRLSTIILRQSLCHGHIIHLRSCKSLLGHGSLLPWLCQRAVSNSRLLGGCSLGMDFIARSRGESSVLLCRRGAGPRVAIEALGLPQILQRLSLRHGVQL